MSAPHNSDSEDDWRQPSEWQEVSNRSILRVQVLSNELRERLNRLPLFRGKNEGKIKKILFAARAPNESLQKDSGQCGERWYQFRLCDSYAFPEELRPWCRGNVHRFQSIFRAAAKCSPTRASFEKFRDSIGGRSQNREDFEQFIIALALIPYRGVLLNLVEEAFGWNPVSKEMQERCCFFDGNPQDFSLHRFNGFRRGSKIWDKPREQEPLLLDSRISESDKLQEFFFDFVLPYTRGEEPKFFEEERKSPYFMEDVSDELPMRGFVAPAYDDYMVASDEKFDQGHWAGGMSGWVFVFCEETWNPDEDCEDTPLLEKDREFSWHAFTQLMRTYVRRVREAHMLDLLEEYAEMNVQSEPEKFLQDNIHHITGWKYASDGPSVIRIPFETTGDPVEIPISPLWDTIDRLKYLGGGKNSPLHAKSHTRYDKKQFADGTVRLCKLFLDGLRLAHGQREVGHGAGQSTTFHDYSKDLNVLEDQLLHYTADVKRMRQGVEEEAEALLASESLPPAARESVQRMVDQVGCLGDPDIDYMLRLQFLMSHLRLKTEGRLYEAPAWCWKLLESGKKRDIYLILRALVWRPFGWRWYDEKAKSLSESTGASDSSNWSRIFLSEGVFLFGEDREEKEPRSVDEKVRQGVDSAFSKLFFQWHILKSDYEASFPPPTVNPDAGWDEQLLWIMDEETREHHSRWLPPAKLLPLFVFAMRTAFEHAFLRNLLRVLDVDAVETLRGQKPRSILLNESKGPDPGGARIHHRIRIGFPAIGLEPDLTTPLIGGRESIVLPYENWTRHMHHYRHAASPWKWFAERVPGSLETDLPDAWHYEITLDARE